MQPDIQALGRQYIAGTYRRFPAVLRHGKGSLVYDENEKEYIDLSSGIAVNTFGYADDVWQAAVTAQLGTLQHTSNLYYSEPCAVLASMLCEKTGMSRVFFSNSGAEANECAIKVARKYAQEKKGKEHYHIITLENSFHGRTITTRAATGQAVLHRDFTPLTAGFHHVPAGDLAGVQKLLDTYPTAAVMIEIVQGEGGVFPATDECIQGIRKFCDEKGILFLLDEVQAGWGRCGSFMSYQSYGVQPDCVSMAKAMGGGMPIGGIACTDKVATAFGPGTHGSTYAGHPVTCAASLAVLREMKRIDAPANAKKVGDYFAAELAKMPHVVEVRHRGLFVGVQLEEGINAVEVKRHCIKNHFLVTAIGSSVIRMVPPLIVRGVDCDKAVEILSKSINEVAEGK